jgi:hypothetical protein
LGITPAGRFYVMASVQTVTNGKFDPSVLYVWWSKNQHEFEQVKKITKDDKSVPIIWLKTVK